jgi:hypothetical protein
VVALANWNAILPALIEAGTNGVAAFTAIKAALAAHGIQADTDQLEKVILDASQRKAHEDSILNG